MYKIAAISLMLFTLFACKKTQVDPISENEDYYNCDDFFIDGDYSSICNIENALPDISSETIDGGGTVCKYIIPALDDTQVDSGVSFVSLQTSSEAENVFNSQRLIVVNAAAEDSLRFHEDILIDGLDAFISEGQFANYSKSVTVRNRNVLVSTQAIYYKNWFPETPCTYQTDELIKLLTEVLENM